MSQALIVQYFVAASQTALNSSRGQWWAKCPQGKVRRIKGIGIIGVGVGICTAAGVPAATGIKFEAKIDDRPIGTFNCVTGHYDSETADVVVQGGDALVPHIDMVMPVNDIMTPGEELNLYATTPANGECIVLLLMQDIDLAEVR